MFTRAPPFICYHLSLIRKKSIALVFLQQQCTTAISWGPWKYNKLIRVHAWYCSKIVSSVRDIKVLGDRASQKFDKKKSIALVLLQQQCTTAISWGPWKYNKLIQVHAWYCSKIVSSVRDSKVLGDRAPQKFEFDKKKKYCTCVLAAAVHDRNFLGPLKIQ